MPRKLKVPARPAPFLAILADCHVGNHARHGGPVVDGLNRRGSETVETFRRAMVAIDKRGCPNVVVAGDLFHSRRPEPAVIRAVQEALFGTRARRYLVPGNHDMLDASAAGGNTAMAPLRDQAYVEHQPGWLSLGAEGFHVLAVPFEGSVPMREHLARVLAEKVTPREERVVLVTHVGVYDGVGAPAWQEKARDGIRATELAHLMADAGVELAFVGNYHEPRAWSFGPAAPGRAGVRIVQVGTLCPASHGDGGLEDRGRIAYLEADGSVTFEEVPGPRFLTCPPDFLSGKLAELAGVEGGYADAGYSFYVRWRGAPGEVPAVSRSSGVVAVDVEEEAPAPSPEVGKQEDAVLTDEDAIRSYAETVELPEGASRERVVELALECWRKA